MNKTIYLIFFILVFIGCTNEETIEEQESDFDQETTETCLLYTSPSPRD